VITRRRKIRTLFSRRRKIRTLFGMYVTVSKLIVKTIREKLLLFLPRRNEESDLQGEYETYEDYYNQVRL